MNDFIIFAGVDGSQRAVRSDSIRWISDDLDKSDTVQITLVDGSWFAAKGSVKSIMSERRIK